jgi:hypothetical protein
MGSPDAYVAAARTRIGLFITLLLSVDATARCRAVTLLCAFGWDSITKEHYASPKTRGEISDLDCEA